MPKETNQNITDNDEVNALLNSSSTSRASPPIHRQSNALSSRPNRFAKLGCTVSILCTVYLLLAIHPTHQTARNQPRINQLPTNNNNRTNTPIFIFGHSTGHSGTGTFHQSLLQPGCPWGANATVDEFEYLAEGERKWNYDVECSLVRERLIPHLVEVVHGKAAYVDLGHFHNRGQTLSCLATILQNQSIFLHIRRNRYDIARSYTDSMTRLASSHPEMKITPCIAKNVMDGVEFGHPHVSTCPRSTEGTVVELSVESDALWDTLGAFQQFLWYADEMEYRWHTLQRMFDDSKPVSTPQFIEVTWNNPEELQEGVNYLRMQLGCSPLESLMNEHPHVEHTDKLNCSNYIWEDLVYRKVMKFNSHKSDVLFAKVPQLVGGDECSESNVELKQKIREYASLLGVEFNEQQWKLAGDDGLR